MRAERDFLLALSQPWPIVRRPFARLAARLHAAPEEVLERIARWKRRGIIRRIGVVLDHNLLGLRKNALVVWRVKASRLARIGGKFAALPEVSHCYVRRTCPDWPYNLYTVVHARSLRERREIIRRMADISGIKDFKTLATVKEFKKTKTDLAALLA